MKTRDKAVKLALFYSPKPFITFEYDGSNCPLFGWALVNSPLAKFVLGYSNDGFKETSYPNVRNIEDHAPREMVTK